MFALFNLGPQELIILGICALPIVAIPVVIILVVALSGKKKDRDD
jgi:hypothetical protein